MWDDDVCYGGRAGILTEGICNVKLVNFCAQALSDFGVTALLRHHRRKVYKDMLSRLRWGSVPMGPPAIHLEAQGNNTL